MRLTMIDDTPITAEIMDNAISVLWEDDNQ